MLIRINSRWCSSSILFHLSHSDCFFNQEKIMVKRAAVARALIFLLKLSAVIGPSERPIAD